jgi:hypothetical protein
MVVITVKEARLVVTVYDLNFEIKDVLFEAKVLNRYGTFDQIANKSMEDPSYAYLHYDLLDRVALTIIILRVKSPYIKIHEHQLQKDMFVKVENFGIESKSKKVLKKVTCMMYHNLLSQQPLCHQFLHSNLR